MNFVGYPEIIPMVMHLRMDDMCVDDVTGVFCVRCEIKQFYIASKYYNHRLQSVMICDKTIWTHLTEA